MDKQIIACDLDGTLAHYDGWKGVRHIGCIVPSIKQAILNAQAQGHEVWIFTARVSDPAEASEAANVIDKWLEENGLDQLTITATKHKFFTQFWDDRALQVIKNTGTFVIEDDNQSWRQAQEPDYHGMKIDPLFTPAEPETSGSTDPLDVQVDGNHYKKYPIQPIEFCHANKIPSLESSIIKYVVRHKDKGGLKDLEKAKHILDILIKLEYNK